jgi:hypothetical protein
MEYDLKKVRQLRGMALRSDDPATVRDRIVHCLATLGVDVAGAPAVVADGPGKTLVLWMSDADWEIGAYAVADDAITPAQRAALDATHFCFADPGDCTEEGWWAALRLMSALGDGQSADDLFVIGVEEPGFDAEAGAPSRQELADTWNAWASHHVANLTTDQDLSWLAARFTAFHAFNKAM